MLFFLNESYFNIEEGFLKIAKLLIEYNAHVDGKCNSETVLMLSCSRAWSESAKLLIENKADINYSVEKVEYRLYEGTVRHNESVWSILTKKYTCVVGSTKSL